MISIVVADITELEVDVIVNAANSTLLGGGGVDGAIHRAAGPELLEACRALGGCPTGEARLTEGFHLPARHVLHAVGPMWHGGDRQEAILLARCYRDCFEQALANDLRSIAFPAISTGAYRFPKEQAARIALAVMRGFEVRLPQILVCCFSDGDAAVYRRIIDAQSRL